MGGIRLLCLQTRTNHGWSAILPPSLHNTAEWLSFPVSQRLEGLVACGAALERGSSTQPWSLGALVCVCVALSWRAHPGQFFSLDLEGHQWLLIQKHGQLRGQWVGGREGGREAGVEEEEGGGHAGRGAH